MDKLDFKLLAVMLALIMVIGTMLYFGLDLLRLAL